MRQFSELPRYSAKDTKGYALEIFWERVLLQDLGRGWVRGQRTSEVYAYPSIDDIDKLCSILPIEPRDVEFLMLVGG